MLLAALGWGGIGVRGLQDCLPSRRYCRVGPIVGCACWLVSGQGARSRRQSGSMRARADTHTHTHAHTLPHLSRVCRTPRMPALRWRHALPSWSSSWLSCGLRMPQSWQPRERRPVPSCRCVSVHWALCVSATCWYCMLVPSRRAGSCEGVVLTHPWVPFM